MLHIEYCPEDRQGDNLLNEAKTLDEDLVGAVNRVTGQIRDQHTAIGAIYPNLISTRSSDSPEFRSRIIALGLQQFGDNLCRDIVAISGERIIFRESDGDRDTEKNANRIN